MPSAQLNLPQLVKTRRLVLVAVTHGMKLALRRSRDTFEAAIGVSLPRGWPQFSEAFEPRDPAPRIFPWHGFLFIHKTKATLIGNGGFIGAPDDKGSVEIGYEIAPAFRDRGYATEAVRAMIDLAFDHEARSIVAHSLAIPNASNAVMSRAGMRFDAEVPNAELGAVWRYRIDRAARTEFEGYHR